MKIAKIFLCVLLMFCTLIFTVGCNSDDDSYPITIGNTTFDSKPEKIAVLSPNVADIISNIGLNKSVTMVSKSVITSDFKNTKTCGDAIEPDTKKIIDTEIEVVLADDNISDGAIKTLEDNDIKVMQFHYGNSGEDILTTYTSVGAILNGESGRSQGQKAYKKLIDTLNVYKSEFGKKHGKEKLLYLDGTGPYISVVKESWYSKLLNFTGTDVIAKGVNNSVYDMNRIEKLNPKYLVSDKETFKSLQNKSILKKCQYNKPNGHIFIEKNVLKLQGVTALNNVEQILKTIDETTYNNIKNSIVEDKNGEITVETTVPTTTPKATNPKEKYQLQSKYNVKFTDDAIKKMTKGSQNDYNKAMQARFVDLGYLASGYDTGFFGDMTKSAISEFQKNNKLKQTGEVDSKTLQVMFSEKAKKK